MYRICCHRSMKVVVAWWTPPNICTAADCWPEDRIHVLCFRLSEKRSEKEVRKGGSCWSNVSSLEALILCCFCLSETFAVTLPQWEFIILAGASAAFRLAGLLIKANLPYETGAVLAPKHHCSMSVLTGLSEGNNCAHSDNTFNRKRVQIFTCLK